MRHRAIVVGALLALTGALSACFAPGDPGLVSAELRRSVNKAEQGTTPRDRQFAMAVYKSLLLPGGASLAVDREVPLAERIEVTRLLERAIGVWHEHLLLTPLRLVSDPAQAHVTVRLTDTLPVQTRHALGLIQLSRRYRWNAVQHQYSVTGQIWIMRSHEGQALSESERLHVLLHEIGHLLGLDDTADTAYLMGPLVRGRPRGAPTPTETATVTSLRGELEERLTTLERTASRAGP